MPKLDESLIGRFAAYSQGKGNSTKWTREQTRQLRRLAARLGPVELAGLELRRLVPAVEGRHHAIATVKALYAYLRKRTFELEPAQDPTLHRLTVPPSRVGPVKAQPPARVRRALRALREPWRSRLRLLRETGIHTTELHRFIETGRIVAYRGQPGAVAFLEVRHKGGQAHRVALSRRQAALARRVKAAGPFTDEAFHLNVKAAGGFTPGCMRHTLATEFVNAGVDMAATATFLGHRTMETTRRYYARFAVPHNPTLAGGRKQRRLTRDA